MIGAPPKRLLRPYDDTLVQRLRCGTKYVKACLHASSAKRFARGFPTTDHINSTLGYITPREQQMTVAAEKCVRYDLTRTTYLFALLRRNSACMPPRDGALSTMPICHPRASFRTGTASCVPRGHHPRSPPWPKSPLLVLHKVRSFPGTLSRLSPKLS